MKPTAPANPHEILQRAASLLHAGRHPDGAKVLRRALDLAPADATVAAMLAEFATLARTYLSNGQVQLALDVLAPLAQSTHANGTLMMLYGHALMMLNHKAEAEAMFRRWLQQEPGNRDAALKLAAVLADNGQSDEAEATVRAAIARSGASIHASFVLGRALLGQARFDEAEIELRKVVHQSPEHLTAQANLMELVWMRTGDIQEATREVDRALRGQPRLPALRLTKARLLISARMPHEALSEIDAGLAVAGNDPDLLAAAVTIALDIDGTRALPYAKRLNELLPGERATRVALGNALLATGDARGALDIATTLHRTDPTDGKALAMQADAMRMLGDNRYRDLMDYARLVRAERIDVPEGWPDLDTYLAELVRDLTHSHVFQAHPIGNSLREGSQIPLTPGQSTYASIRAFPQAIHRPILHYMQAIGHGTDAMRRRNTGRYGIAGIWSVRLRPSGFHANHYHPDGWISSACYLHLPSAVDREGGEGWLKFGEPAFPTTPALEPEYFVKPEPGLLVLFPSYMWHGTVPFSGSEQENRLTIAFDVIPTS